MADFVLFASDDHAVSRMSTIGALITSGADCGFWFIHVPCSSTLDVVAGDVPQCALHNGCV